MDFEMAYIFVDRIRHRYHLAPQPDPEPRPEPQSRSAAFPPGYQPPHPDHVRILAALESFPAAKAAVMAALRGSAPPSPGNTNAF